jgi:hypothetical protein
LICPWQNGRLQQIAANRFSTPQDVIAILLQGFVLHVFSGSQHPMPLQADRRSDMDILAASTKPASKAGL